MKICLVSEYFYPQSSGGTEKYVYDLAKKLLAEFNDVEVLTAGEISREYQYDGVRVKVLSSNRENSADVISGKVPAANAEDFKDQLRSSKYDLVHFHTLTPAFNLHHIRIAKEISKQIHFTAHVPSVTCIHGDLMQFGKAPCDGLILNHRCTACYLSKKNISIPMSKILTTAISLINYPKVVVGVVKQKKSDLSDLNILCDKIYVFTNWQHRVFIANGFNPDKLQITSQILDKKISPNKYAGKKNLKKIGFVGRLTPEKGLHILLDAFIKSGRNDLELHIAGIKDLDHLNYFERLKSIAATKSNVLWNFDLSKVDIMKFYQQIDVLCIPSVWYETGPFVLYEAFENHIPVIANNLGDMKDWKDKGYPIELYHNVKELTNLLRNNIHITK